MRHISIALMIFILYVPLLEANEISNNNLHEFAQDGLNIGKPLMNKSTENVLDKFGLPDRILIRKKEAYWDIDIEQTPTDWVYSDLNSSGLLISTFYYRDGLIKEGVSHLVPGPYYESKTVSGITVNKNNTPIRYGLGVGAKKTAVLEKLGKPTEKKENAITYVSNTHKDIRRDIIVSFTFDKNMVVKEIEWSLTSWH